MTDEQIEGTVELTDTTPPELAAALVLAWSELSSVTKTKTADMGTYKVTYADLADVLDVVRPILGKYELALLQPVERYGDRVMVHTILLHSSGQSMSWVFDVHAAGSPQQVGSAITYARRYSAMSALGIAAAGDDDDGVAAARSRPPVAPESRRRGPSGMGEDERLTRRAMALFGEYGLRDRADRLAETSRILGRDVASWNDLELAEQRRVVKVLEAKSAQDEDAETLDLERIDDDNNP